METLPQDGQSSGEILFYDKHSNFDLQSQLKTCLTQGSQDYTLDIAQNEIFANEIALANSDFSIQMMDLNTMQLASFKQSSFHTDKINEIRCSNINDNEQLQHVVFSASSDGMIKLWDRRNGECVHYLQHMNKPFFTVDTDKNIISGGTNSEILFWDLRKMKQVNDYNSSHTDDVTAVRYHPANPSLLATCSTDNLLCLFDFNGKPSTKEDDTMDGVYCSEQPLIDCGFISNNLMWAQTSINTIEIVTIENFDVYSKITKFPHKVDYVIGCGEDKFTQKFVMYCGNNQGEVYIYELVDKNQINLVDMILTKEDTIVRNAQKVSNDQIVLTTEKGDLKLFKYVPSQQPVTAVAADLEFHEGMEVTDEDPELKIGTKKNAKSGFKPF